RQRRLRTALRRAGSRPTPRLVALWPLHRAILRRGGFLARVAHPPSPQPQSPRRPSIPAPVEHHSSQLRPDVFPLCLAGHHHPDPTVAGCARIRGRSIRPRRFLVRSPATCDCSDRRSAASLRIGFPFAHGRRLYLHCRSLAAQRPVHQRVVRRRLLSLRTAHGRWSIFRLHRTGLYHRPAGHLYRRTLQAAGRANVLSLLPRCALARRPDRRRFHDALHRRPRTAPLQFARITCATGQLDQRGCHPATHRRPLGQILRTACRHRPRCRIDQRPRSPAGLHPHVYRRLSLDRLGLRRRPFARRIAEKISSGLWRTRLSRRGIRSKDKLMNKLTCTRLALLCLLLPLTHAATATAQETTAKEAKLPAPRQISLEEAVQMALKHNHVVRISQFKVEEKQHTKDLARSAYFPILRNDSNLARVTDTEFIGIPAGGLGIVGGTPIPDRTVILNQGGRTLVTSGTGLTQPLSELWKTKSANDVAAADLSATRDKAHQTENAVALKVHQLYYLILIAQAHREAAQAKIQATEALQQERVEQVKYGSSLEEEGIESRAQFLEAKQELLTTDL